MCNFCVQFYCVSIYHIRYYALVFILVFSTEILNRSRVHNWWEHSVEQECFFPLTRQVLSATNHVGWINYIVLTIFIMGINAFTCVCSMYGRMHIWIHVGICACVAYVCAGGLYANVFLFIFLISRCCSCWCCLSCCCFCCRCNCCCRCMYI